LQKAAWFIPGRFLQDNYILWMLSADSFLSFTFLIARNSIGLLQFFYF